MCIMLSAKQGIFDPLNVKHPDILSDTLFLACCFTSYQELLLTHEDCKDPCGYCWTLAALPERIACFHSCCAGKDDDDIYPIYSDACIRAEALYEYDDYGGL
eukprot:scaffold131372_cov32-Prasinocladus_malaysianus.AAC.2